MVNGNTWPFQRVEQRRYRLRFLNGCQSRFLILDFSNIPGVEVWQIGNEGGFLAAPVGRNLGNPVFKDTVIAYPGEVTRIRAHFITPGQFVWHCHIVEHEDNEMMRPFRIGPVQPGQPST